MKAAGAVAVLVGAVSLLGCGSNQGAAEQTMLEDASFLGFVDDNGDGRSFDDAPRNVHFSDFFAKNRPGTRIIMLNAAAGWCGPCMHEAAELTELSTAYSPKGLLIVTAVFQKDDATASDEAFTRLWAETFKLSVPTLVDSSFLTRKYFDVNTLPANMFIDAESTEIITVATGAKPGDDPLAEYRAWLNDRLK
jgi:thiol-disulfide isomerase/thioredoxin